MPDTPSVFRGRHESRPSISSVGRLCCLRDFFFVHRHFLTILGRFSLFFGSCTIFVEILAQTRDRLGVKKKGQWPWNSLKNTTSSYWVCLI
ncbi:MAG: hypothetical protein AB7T27_11150, partial [Kiritimatiellia bacterium]